MVAQQNKSFFFLCKSNCPWEPVDPGVFNKTIILLGLSVYEVIITNPVLCLCLCVVTYHFISSTTSLNDTVIIDNYTMVSGSHNMYLETLLIVV